MHRNSICSQTGQAASSHVPGSNIISMGVDYLTVICVFGFGQMFQLIFEKILQSTGRTSYTMVMQMVGAVINIILDPILIFGYFGLPAMGTRGAAIATVVGQIIAMLLGLYFNLAKNKDVQFNYKSIELESYYFKGICTVGIPTIIMQSMSSVMCFGINKLLLNFSTTSTEVFGAYFKLQTFVYMTIFGLNNALIPIVAFNLGAKHADRIRRVIRLSGAYSALIGWFDYYGNVACAVNISICTIRGNVFTWCDGIAYTGA